MNSNKIVQLLNPTSNQDAATKSYVDNSIPIGGIIMWSGTTGTSLPSNWKLCDGSTYNGIKTPDLRGRFVLSSTTQMSANGNIALAGGLSTRNVDQTGGVETVTLTEQQMPSHSHSVSARTGNSSGQATDGGHTHNVSASGTPQLPVYNSLMFSTTGSAITLATTSAQQFQTNGGTVSVSGTASNTSLSHHNHTITVSETAKGSDQAHENMPPFYVLAFIMRIS
jgi:microcystin-dependent protein